jgi:hypothetical protein
MAGPSNPALGLSTSLITSRKVGTKTLCTTRPSAHKHTHSGNER